MKDNTSTIQVMKDFVEGKMSMESFWNAFNESDEILKVLLNDPNRKDLNSYFRADLLREHVDIHTAKGASGFYHRVYMYFFRNHIEVKATDQYQKAYRELLEIQPDWLELDEEYLRQLLSEAPTEFTKTKKKSWCKKEILRRFRYLKKPPQWIQFPQWMMTEDHQPMIFSHQSKPIPNSDCVTFYFIHPTTNETYLLNQHF